MLRPSTYTQMYFYQLQQKEQSLICTLSRTWTPRVFMHVSSLVKLRFWEIWHKNHIMLSCYIDSRHERKISIFIILDLIHVLADHPHFFLFFPVKHLSVLHFANLKLDQASEHFSVFYRSQVNQIHRPYLQQTSRLILAGNTQVELITSTPPPSQPLLYCSN